MAIPLGRPSPGASRDLPENLARKGAWAGCPAPFSYLVLLPVGFTMPAPLPEPRCALTAPFHPYLPTQLALLWHGRPEGLPRRSPKGEGGRFVLCGTFPGVAPAGRYPAPYVKGARTFLPGGLSTVAGAAVRPTDGRRH